MKRQVIEEQVLTVRIESPSWAACGHGYCDTIPGKVWYVGEFTSQEEADAIFEEVQRRYQAEEVDKQSWMKKPEMKIRWETTSTRMVEQ